MIKCENPAHYGSDSNSTEMNEATEVRDNSDKQLANPVT